MVRSLVALLALVPAIAKAQATPGYPERVLQWTVQPGETCQHLAAALYGAERFAHLLTRYNDIDCTAGNELTIGQTLVVPERVTNLTTATLESLSPEVRARVAGGNWIPALPGMPLNRNDSVNTLERARADILFADRTHVVMAEHTLVVVYDTASQSALTQKRPPAILLEEGELQTALAALRPKAESQIDVKGGGQVSASSKDTVLRKRDKRTTVSVFDGTARVSSGGATVHVPARHGSSFIVAQRPTPPRPLPPPPAWQSDCTRGPTLAGNEGGVIRAHWASVANSKFYRVEFAHDPQFAVPIVREQVPADIHSFRAEKLPPGSYYVRVRTIDNDDFLGIASQSLAVEIVRVNLSGVLDQSAQTSIVVSPYGSLSFATTHGVQMALDDGGFGPIPARLDFLSVRPKLVKFRQVSDHQQSEYQIHYRAVQVQAEALNTTAGRKVIASFSGVEPSELWTRLKPTLRLSGPGFARLLTMLPTTEAGVAQVSLPSDVREPFDLDVLDQQGNALKRVEPFKSATAIKAKARSYATGPCAAVAGMEVDSSASWAAPTSCDAVSVAAKLSDSGDGSPAGQGLVRVSGMFGAIGLDALIQTNASHLAQVDNLAWFGARWRAFAWRSWSFGPLLRVGLPPTHGATGEQLESALALAWQNSRWAWITDIGLRNQVQTSVPRQTVTLRDYFLVSGFTYRVHDWFSTYATLDAHLGQQLVTNQWSGRFSGTLGFETTGTLFVGFGTRFSPFGSAVGSVTSQLALGIRR